MLAQVPHRDSHRRRFGQFHCALELWRILFDTKILGVKFRDPFHIVAAKRRRFRRLGEFNKLFFVVNVRQSGSDTLVSK